MLDDTLDGGAGVYDVFDNDDGATSDVFLQGHDGFNLAGGLSAGVRLESGGCDFGRSGDVEKELCAEKHGAV